MLDSASNNRGTLPLYGRASLPVTLVKVTWYWVILPYGLCSATIVFLLTTVYASRRANATLWKSSINAFLYHGIDFDSNIWTPLASIPEMNTQAGAMRVKLAPQGRWSRLMLETTTVKDENEGEEEKSWLQRKAKGMFKTAPDL